jgi:SAM-dependent methyltransferase
MPERSPSVPPGAGLHRHADLYADPPPWDIGRPQPALRALAEAGAIRGRVLDVGCGTGEHTLMAAALGLDATGADLAVTALRTAEEKARDRGLGARFLRQDVRRLAELGESFDTALDCGLFHSLTPGDRPVFAAALRAVLRPGGRYFLLAFSDEGTGDWQPHRLARADITGAFADGWRTDSVERATIEVTVRPYGVPAWLATLTRAEDRPDGNHATATAEAVLRTDRPTRYLTQLFRHAAAMSGGHGHRAEAHADVRVRAELSGTRGVLTFEPWGRCVAEATATTLLLRAEAGDEEGLRRIQEVVAADLVRFGHREGLKVTWLSSG